MRGIIDDSEEMWDNPYTIGENSKETPFFPSKNRQPLENKLTKMAYVT